MDQSLTPAQLRAKLQMLVDRHGVRGTSRKIGISPSYICDYLSQPGRKAGARLLAALGVRETISYVPVRR